MTMETNKEQHTPEQTLERALMALHLECDPSIVEDIRKKINTVIKRQADNPYKTACEAINPENPLVVAENLRYVDIFLKQILNGDLKTLSGIQARAGALIIELTKIQAKP